MNILISTTTNWNPGDDFIRYGVKKILNNYFKTPINWIHYDRNPDLFKPDEWKMGDSHKSNIMNSDIDWSIIDMVVLAGSPEFIHGPLCNLYDGLVNHPNIPLLVLGIGYSDEVTNLELTESELLVLNRKNTLIITRQHDLKDKLREILSAPIIVACLPCPAIFASRGITDTRKLNHLLLIPQISFGEQPISELDFRLTQSEICGLKYDIACHYIEDFKVFKTGFFSSDAMELLKHITKYPEVISNRLHGGIAALGNGAEVKFINSSNRVQKALEPYKKYENNGWYKINEYDLIYIYEDYKSKLLEFFNGLK